MTPIFVLSFRGSSRLIKIKKNLKSLSLRFKVIYGIDGRKSKNNNFLDSVYNRSRAESSIGRKMLYTEIACAYGHLKIYNQIIKKKLSQAIILEDDIFVSKDFKYWVLKNKSLKNFDLLAFIATSGFIKKISAFEKFYIYKFISHFYSTGAYQINIKTCNKIIKFSKNKVVGFADWPINLMKHNIKAAIVTPFLVMLRDQQYTFVKNDRDKSFKRRILKKILPKNLLRLISIFYYIFFIPYIFRIYKDLDYYKERFFKKKILLLYSYILRKKINLISYTSDLNQYSKDLNRNQIRSSIRYLHNE
jgi:GR25 family glycosyltransferase involved in LPS biosynthesis